MKKLDFGARSPKIKLSNAISRSLATITLVASCQVGLAQYSQNTQPTIGNIQGYSLATKINNQYIVVLKDSAVFSATTEMSSSNLSAAEARAAVVQEMSISLATQARGTVKQMYSSAINGFVKKLRCC